MDYEELKLQIYDLLMAISINMMPQLQEEFNNTLWDLKQITDEGTLINQINKLTNVIKEYNKNHCPNDSYLFKKEMENIKERYQRIQVSLSNIQPQNTENLQDLKSELKSLFDTLKNILHFQYEKIVQLESKVEILETSRTETEKDLATLKKKVQEQEKKFKLQEKMKLIGDLLIPLSQEIHNFLETLNGKPHYYDDACIYSAFQEKASNHQTNENQYKLYFGKPVDLETYDQFYLFLFEKSTYLNMNIHVFLLLLRGKKIRNFIQHSDLWDFFADSVTNFKYNFIDLIQKHDLEDVFDAAEFSGLKNIYETYFRNFIAEAQQREQQTTHST